MSSLQKVPYAKTKTMEKHAQKYNEAQPPSPANVKKNRIQTQKSQRKEDKSSHKNKNRPLKDMLNPFKALSGPSIKGGESKKNMAKEVARSPKQEMEVDAGLDNMEAETIKNEITHDLDTQEGRMETSEKTLVVLPSSKGSHESIADGEHPQDELLDYSDCVTAAPRGGIPGTPGKVQGQRFKPQAVPWMPNQTDRK